MQQPRLSLSAELGGQAEPHASVLVGAGVVGGEMRYQLVTAEAACVSWRLILRQAGVNTAVYLHLVMYRIQVITL